MSLLGDAGMDQAGSQPDLLPSDRSVVDSDAAPAKNELKFSAGISWGAGFGSDLGAVAGLFDDDAFPDIVAIGSNNKVVLYKGDGAGGFAPSNVVTLANLPIDITAGDLNNDSRLDLVTSEFAQEGVSTFLGGVGGTFAKVGTYGPPGGYKAYYLTLALIDGDANLDVVSGNGQAAGPTVPILLGNGDGTLRPGTTIADPRQPETIAAADLNRDGLLDLVAANVDSSDTVTVYLGTGVNQFGAGVEIPTGSSTLRPLLADFNGDGYLDLVAGGFNAMLQVRLSGKNGTFLAPSAQLVGTGDPSVPSVADLDGDGQLDLALDNITTGTITVLLGNGDGTFQPGKTIAVGTRIGRLLIADFNHDGRPDLAMTTTATPNVSAPSLVVMLNQSAPL
ncbi:MAG TPA: VCBS repeat-containing protein [Polyangia bacterium]